MNIKLILILALFLDIFFSCDISLSTNEVIQLKVDGPIGKLDFEINSEPVKAYWYNVRVVNNGDNPIYLMIEKDSIFPPMNYQYFSNESNRKLPIFGRWERTLYQVVSIKGNSENYYKFWLTELPNVDTVSYFFNYSLDSIFKKQEIIKVDCIVKDKWNLNSIYSRRIEVTPTSGP